MAQRTVLTLFWLPIALVMALQLPAVAGTVERVGVADLARDSVLIFEGRVIKEQARWIDGGRALATFVTFEIDDVLKGESAQQTVTLRYLGGEVDGVRLEISGLQRPALGERGIYFVDRAAGKNVHPLTGWDQGHFLVVEGLESERILTTTARPVLNVTGRHKAVGGFPAIQTGSAADFDRALTLSQFKTIISDLVLTTS